MDLEDKIREPFYAGYIAAALWSTYDDNGTPLDVNFCAADIADESLEIMITDCDEFLATIAANGISREMLAGLYNPTDGDDPLNWAGHDFWLTRNGHGTGFWDRGFDVDISDELTDCAQRSGEVWIEVGDDGRLYQV